MTDRNLLEAASYLAIEPNLFIYWINSDLDKICSALKLSPKPKIVFEKRDYSKAYLKKNKIMIGLKMIDMMSICTEVSELREIRGIMVHEGIHHMKGGHGHDDQTRKLGYWSADNRDTLSPKVTSWIFDGDKKPPELTKLEKYWKYYYLKDGYLTP